MFINQKGCHISGRERASERLIKKWAPFANATKIACPRLNMHMHVHAYVCMYASAYASVCVDDGRMWPVAGAGPGLGLLGPQLHLSEN